MRSERARALQAAVTRDEPFCFARCLECIQRRFRCLIVAVPETQAAAGARQCGNMSVVIAFRLPHALARSDIIVVEHAGYFPINNSHPHPVPSPNAAQLCQ